MKLNSKSLWEWFFHVVVWALLLTRVLLHVFWINRGFDIGDEGFFCSVYRIDNYDLDFPQLLLIKDVFGSFVNTVVGARLVSLFLSVLATVLSWIFVKHFVRTRGFQTSFVGAVLFSFLLLSPFSRVITYNELGNLAGVTGLLSLIAPFIIGIRKKHKWMLNVLLGVLLFFCFGSKPFIVPYLAVVFIILHLSGEYRLTSSATASILVSCSFLLPLIIFSLHYGGIHGFIQHLWLIAEETSHSTGHGFYNTVVDRYLHNDLFFFVVLTIPSMSPLFVVYLSRNWPRRTRSFTNLISLLVSVFTMMAFIIGMNMSIEERYSYSYILVLVFVFITLAIDNRNRLEKMMARKARPMAKVVISFIPLPFFAMLGSNVSMSLMVGGYLLSWGIVLSVLLVGCVSWKRSKVTAYGTLIVLVSLTSFQFIYQQVFFPHGLHKSILDQKEVVSFSGQSLLVDSESKRFIDDIRTTLKEAGLVKGSPIIATGFKPGLVYLLGGYSQKVPFLHFEELGSAYNCLKMDKMDFLENKPFLIIDNPVDRETRICMEESPIEFNPDNYRVVGDIFNPYSRAHSYRHFNKTDRLVLFAPK